MRISIEKLKEVLHLNKIVLYDIVQQSNAETTELGDKVYNVIKPQIEEYISKEEQFVIDFTNINIITTAFLNNAIGKLFYDISSKDLIQNMSFSGISSVQLNSLRWSIRNAIQKASVR